MAIVEVGEFLAEYDRFSQIPDHVIQAKMDFVEQCYCPAKWGAKQKHGIKLATAHILEMENFQTAEMIAASYGVTSGSGGRSPSGSDDDFNLTTFGRQFKELKKTIPAFGIVI